MTVGEGGHRREGHLQGTGKWPHFSMALDTWPNPGVEHLQDAGRPHFRAHRNLPSSFETTQKSPMRVSGTPSNSQRSRRHHNNNNNSNDNWMKVCCNELAAAQSCLIGSVSV